MKRCLLIGLLLAMTLIAGCGVYTFNPKGKSTISSVSVEPFRNLTPEYTLADRMTNVITDALLEDGSMKVLPADVAETELVGSLTGYERKPSRFDENDQVLQYKVVLVFEVSLINLADKTEIWKEIFNQEGLYDVDTETEEDGQTKALTFLVEAIINRTTKSW
jgi:hypothetical protein